MNANWLGIGAACLAIIAFVIVYPAARRMDAQRRGTLALVSLFLAVPGASFAIYYLHVLPEPAWYYQFRSIRGTEGVLVFVGIAGALVGAILPRLLMAPCLLGVAALAFVPFAKPFIGPLDPATMLDRWNGSVCLQTTSSTCGAASVATILNGLGEKVTEAELAADAHSYSGGTEAWYLARAVRSRGCKVRFHFSSAFDAQGPWPAVVGVRLGYVGHFIPVLGREADNFVIGDPLKGREVLSHEELLERYDFTGFHMQIRKG